MPKKLMLKKGIVTSLSYFGNLAFGYLDGTLRFSLRKDNLGVRFIMFKESVSIGDLIEFSGTVSKKFGENQLEVRSILSIL